MSNHTPEPWFDDRATHDEPYQNIKILGDENRGICWLWIDDAPVDDWNSEQRANANRIVTCVNACKGMADPAAEIAELRRQRDELVQQNANMQLRINELLVDRNATGVAIDNAISGRLPEQHQMLNRLRMIANIAAHRNELVAENDRLRTALECATSQLREFGVLFVVGGGAS